MTGQAVSRIIGLVDDAGPHDISIADGRVVERRVDGLTLHADGRVVVPAFVDAHVHLDKAYLLAPADAHGPSGSGVDAAIMAMQQVRRDVSFDVVAEGARRGARALVENGVVAARAHVEIGPTDESLLELHLHLRDELAGVLDLQLSAFPQNGLDREVLSRMEDAIKDGVEVVGGCPYVDDDQHEHLDAVFELAARHGRPLDLHLDFDDRPLGSMIPAVAERTRALGMAGQVTIGHVTKLAAMSVRDQAEALSLLAEADIALVVMPATDLYLGGAGEPGSRSMAPLERAAAAGVRVAVSNNNLHNAFSPYGNGNLLQAAWTAGLTRHMGSSTDRKTLLDAVTHVPAGILGRDPHGTRPGDRADLVVLDTRHPADVVLQNPPVSASVVHGRLAYHREALGVTEPEGPTG